MNWRLWPRSLQGQMLLAVALALLLAQGISAMLLYRAQTDRLNMALVHTAAFRLVRATRTGVLPPGMLPQREQHEGADDEDRPRSFRLEHDRNSPLQPGDRRDVMAEAQLRSILADQEFPAADVVVFKRRIKDDPVTLRNIELRVAVLGPRARPPGRKVLVAGVRLPQSDAWLVSRVIVPPGEGALLMTLIGQTLFIYVVLVWAIAFILRRITQPLAALTERVELFGQTRDAEGQLAPQGPDDVQRLIEAHNAMEDRIAALLREKDVMLGAIGHDLKTPLAALRVRIESVEDAGERARMAGTIEDIVRTLDDILSLARVGHPSESREKCELSALVSSVVEEYEDMGEDVELGELQRTVLMLRPTWLRRALRNLIGNALRYGQRARISLNHQNEMAVIGIDDDGPGIPDGDIARMQEPFARGDPSRNSSTGGSGLGLALARAIVEQHGGYLIIRNRLDSGGMVAGLSVRLVLPLAQ